jgi:hypothetical protein
MKLPKGWKVKKDNLIGYTFFLGKDELHADIVVQHPVDNDAIRKYIKYLDEQHKRKDSSES